MEAEPLRRLAIFLSMEQGTTVRSTAPKYRQTIGLSDSAMQRTVSHYCFYIRDEFSDPS
jgi:hypothetical protein